MKKHTMKFAAVSAAVLMVAAMAGCSKSNTAETAASSSAAETLQETETAAESKSVTDEQADKAKVGIAWVADFENMDSPEAEDVMAYVHSIEKAGGEAVLLPRVTNEEEAKAALATVGAVIMSGGEDISPSYYNEEPDEMLGEVNEDRDTSDYWMITAALKEDAPILATCRGLQMLNSVCGGTLYQDIPTQYETDIEHRDPALEDFTYHNITIDDGNKLSDLMGAGTLEVNSWHHQGVKELGKNLKVIALGDDGIVEAFEKTDNTYVLGVQFHPEWHVEDGNDAFLPFFEKLVELAGQ